DCSARSWMRLVSRRPDVLGDCGPDNDPRIDRYRRGNAPRSEVIDNAGNAQSERGSDNGDFRAGEHSHDPDRVYGSRRKPVHRRMLDDEILDKVTPLTLQPGIEAIRRTLLGVHDLRAVAAV